MLQCYDSNRMSRKLHFVQDRAVADKQNLHL